MIDETITVRWIVDPGAFHGYKQERVLEFIEWLEKWDKPVFPSSRYHRLVNNGVHFWGAHTFFLGLTEEAHADEFRDRWGGFKTKGLIVSGEFVIAGRYDDARNWK